MPDGDNQDSGRKMVPESDLIAVKNSLEGKMSELKVQLEDSKKNADTHYQTVLQERAAKADVEKRLQELQTLATSAESIKQELEAAKSGRAQLETQLMDISKRRLQELYKVPETSIVGKSQRELDIMEEALKLVGPKNLVTVLTGGGSGNQVPMTAREKTIVGLRKLHPNN